MSQTVARTKRKKKSHTFLFHLPLSLSRTGSASFGALRVGHAFRCGATSKFTSTTQGLSGAHNVVQPAQRARSRKRQINRYEFDLHPRFRFPPSLHSFRGVVASCCFKKVSSGAALHIRSPPWHACTTYVLEYCGECCVHVWFTHPTMCGIKILLTDFKYGCCLTPRGKLVQTKYAFTENTEYLFNKVLYSRRVLMC